MRQGTWGETGTWGKIGAWDETGEVPPYSLWGCSCLPPPAAEPPAGPGT